MKEAAYKALSNVQYTGEKNNFTFENYVNVHQKAYAELEHYNEPVLPMKQVRDFLSGIKDRQLKAATAVVRATETLSSELTAAANYISLFTDAQAKPRARNLSQVDTDGRGRGRGRGRGGRGRGAEEGFLDKAVAAAEVEANMLRAQRTDITHIVSMQP